MQVEDLSVVIRPRNPWEAMDLGFAMVRHWWRDVYLAWFAVVLPMFLILNVVFYDSPVIAMIAFWWLKPFYDRVLLLVFSRAVFGGRARLRDVYMAIPGFIKTGLLGHLTVFRLLDLMRSFRLPVMQLEGLEGENRKERLKVLSQLSSGHALWLTGVCINFELFLQIGFIGLVGMFLPVQSDISLFNLFVMEDASFWIGLMTNLFYMISMSLIEPAYVAAGFALYLNRRTALEGWDIELIFRRIAARLVKLGGAVAALMLVIMLGWLSPMFVNDAYADEDIKLIQVASPPLDVSESKRVILEVLKHDDFEQYKEDKAWRYIGEPDEDKKEDAAATDYANLGTFIAQIFEAVFWIGLFFGTVFIALKLTRYFGERRSAMATEEIPEAISGLDIRPESLPGDIPSEVTRLWRAGKPREALSLLYRSTLSALVHGYGIALKSSFTEGDVLATSQKTLGRDAQQLLDHITAQWQNIAYAHRAPGEDEVMAALKHWPPYFGAGHDQVLQT
ncbi:MAG: DUF4129 domain-containing protein [Gammaproteobacteria bacterium]|nr:MAG: DUF4129 domain-containing protein [Gammaproteobacteria bacterium]